MAHCKNCGHDLGQTHEAGGLTCIEIIARSTIGEKPVECGCQKPEAYCEDKNCKANMEHRLGAHSNWCNHGQDKSNNTSTKRN